MNTTSRSGRTEGAQIAGVNGDFMQFLGPNDFSAPLLKIKLNGQEYLLLQVDFKLNYKFMGKSIKELRVK